jgi:potassium-transporting ATPase KdpC subunit
MVSQLRPALVLFAVLTALCCMAYPLAVTGVGRALFPAQVAGSMVARKGDVIGSRLIGQSFSAARYVWGRPSATSPMPYNAASSGASNLGPLNPALIDAVKVRVAALRAADPGNKDAIPVDLVTASASGLDPEISLAGALYQASRVARARHVDAARVRALIEQRAERGLFGEPRVNVLALNLALDEIAVE